MKKYIILICLVSFMFFPVICFAQWYGMDSSQDSESENNNKLGISYGQQSNKKSQTYSGTDYIRKGGVDRDTDNDGVWDYGKGGVDRDTDSDGTWDYNKGGVDRDADNDGVWDSDKGGVDRDLDNDGAWDYGRGGVDRDMDNDGTWDY